MKIQKVKRMWAGAAVSGGMIALIAVAMLCPMQSVGVDAAECTDQAPEACPAMQTASTRATVGVASTLAVALTGDNVQVDVTPTSEGAFAKNAAKLSVSTNSGAGYTVSLATVNGESELIGPTVGETVSKIGPVTNGKTGATFDRNTWGYNLDTADLGDQMTFSPVPATQQVVKETSLPSSDTYNLTFGAKVDGTLPSGDYTNAVIVSVVANPKKVTLNDITTMQEMTSSICSNTSEGIETRLTDTRDNQLYYVAKLKDGNCWMTQNLYFNGTSLTSADSDVPAGKTYNLNRSINGDPMDLKSTSPEYNMEIGSYQLKNPTTYQDLTNAWDALESWTSDRNEHYALGNYYSWFAATAGTGATTPYGQDAPGSVCPKGWRLPGNGQMDSLIQKYGFSWSGSNAVVYPRWTAAPTYFTGAGYIVPANNASSGIQTLFGTGSSGAYWGSYNRGDYTDDYAVYAGSMAANFGAPVDSSDGPYGAAMISVRCVAR